MSEAEPFAKTGGLADVASSLAKALARRGHDIRLILPLYRQVERARLGVHPTSWQVPVELNGRRRNARVWQSVVPGSRVHVYLLDQPDLFDRQALYQEYGHDYPDNLERFSVFVQAVLRLIPQLGWQPDILHCHDWQTALACAYASLKTGAAGALAARLKTVLTVHNLSYQGLFPAAQWPLTGLPPEAFSVQGLEFYGQINCLKGGLMYADALTTVSPTYAKEIQTPAFGCGLDGVLRDRAHELTGILNGIDADVWNPQTDPHLPATYSAARPAGKAECKRALQRAQGLAERDDELLIGMVQRLVGQKGIDLFLAAAEQLLEMPVQVVLLGAGEPAYHKQLDALAARHPGRVSVTLAFHDALAHQIEAGADAFLMASRFEPCGLNQMYSMRYGTVPIVRRVGGLADTVVDATPEHLAQRRATGFVFREPTPEALVEAVRRAVNAFLHRGTWTQLMRTGMAKDVSWTRSAGQYEALYARLLERRVGPRRPSAKARTPRRGSISRRR